MCCWPCVSVDAGRTAVRPMRCGASSMDRQLADGGWNVGTTITFGKQTWPTPEATGLACKPWRVWCRSQPS